MTIRAGLALSLALAGFVSPAGDASSGRQVQGERHALTRVIRLASVCDHARLPVAEYAAALAAPVLETSEKYASWDAFYRRLFQLDADADDAWAKIATLSDFDERRHHYACPHDDEETAKMLYLLGSSLVGRRAGELIVLGKEAKRRFGKNPTIVTTGRLAVAAAHAIAAELGLFTDHDFIDLPPSWENAIRMRAQSLYSTSVHGAMLKYDWVDLCDGGNGSK